LPANVAPFYQKSCCIVKIFDVLLFFAYFCTTIANYVILKIHYVSKKAKQQNSKIFRDFSGLERVFCGL
jgi:phage shock protein PspC (stress-responsive transcriptional regulator)